MNSTPDHRCVLVLGPRRAANIPAPLITKQYNLVLVKGHACRKLTIHVGLAMQWHVNHILIECPQFNHLRQQYHFGSTLKELFNNTSVNDIIAFIKDTHFYTRI